MLNRINPGALLVYNYMCDLDILGFIVVLANWCVFHPIEGFGLLFVRPLVHYVPSESLIKEL